MKAYIAPTNFPSPEDNIFLTVNENKFVLNYHFSGPTRIYLIKFSNISSTIKWEMCLKLTIKVPDIVLVSLLLTLNIFDMLF